MSDEIKEKVFLQDAKQIVDALYDKGIFKDTLTRDGLQSVEDYLAYLLDSRFASKVRGEALVARLKTHGFFS